MKLDICVSDRCFFPWSAFKSPRKVVKLAKSLGYEQVEFHPVWSVWFESLVKGRLSCQPEDISSYHIDWRQDRVQEGFGFWERFTSLPSQLFPPTFLAIKVIQKLEGRYKK